MGRDSFEIKRNLFHLLLGAVIVILLYFGFIDVWILAGVTVVGFILSLRHRRKRVPLIDWFIQVFERQHEQEEFPGRGAFYMMLGITLAVALFPEPIALASVSILAVGDSLSPLIATRLGRIRHPLNREKVLDASAAGFFIAFMSATFFVSLAEAFIASYIAMFVESIDYLKGRKIEDNITIPLVAGLSIVILRMFVLI
jgi:dolichol kinase